MPYGAVVGCSEVDVLAFEFAAFVASAELAEPGGQFPDTDQVEVSRRRDISRCGACLEETLGGDGPIERQMSSPDEVDGVIVQASGEIGEVPGNRMGYVQARGGPVRQGAVSVTDDSPPPYHRLQPGELPSAEAVDLPLGVLKIGFRDQYRISVMEGCFEHMFEYSR